MWPLVHDNGPLSRCSEPFLQWPPQGEERSVQLVAKQVVRLESLGKTGVVHRLVWSSEAQVDAHNYESLSH